MVEKFFDQGGGWAGVVGIIQLVDGGTSSEFLSDHEFLAICDDVWQIQVAGLRPEKIVDRIVPIVIVPGAGRSSQ